VPRAEELTGLSWAGTTIAKGVAVADVATADADATYGQPEADLINECKDQLNALLASLRTARLMGAAVADVATADADATWGTPEVTLVNEIKDQLNALLASLRGVGVITT
jgi:hypothetical protein